MSMESNFQSEGRWEVVEIVANFWAAILYRRASVEKKNQEKKRERFMCTVRVVVGKGEIYCLLLNPNISFSELYFKLPLV